MLKLRPNKVYDHLAPADNICGWYITLDNKEYYYHLDGGGVIGMFPFTYPEGRPKIEYETFKSVEKVVEYLIKEKENEPSI